jgi:ABC-2 type transport system permease protein
MRVTFIAPTVTEFSLFGGILGEVVLGLILLTLFTIFVIWLSAKIFRVGIFMTGKRATLPEVMKWVRR